MNKTPDTAPQRAFSPVWLLPHYWLDWLLIGLWRLLAVPPWRMRLAIGAALGKLLRRLSGRRRRIAQANIAVCRAQLGLSQAQAVVLERRHFENLGMGFVESATAWWSSPALITERLSARVEGRELITQLQQQGRGVLLLPLHYTFLELLPGLLHLDRPLTQIPRPHNNPLLEYFMHRGRSRWAPLIASKDGPWGMLKVLRRGGVCIYFADQDYGAKGGLFCPFFGMPAYTTVLGRRMAQRAGAGALLLEMRREEGVYTSRLHPFDEYLQAADDEAATAMLHERFEAIIRRAPEQWLWSHRRFKTRPPGQEHLYPGKLAKR